MIKRYFVRINALEIKQEIKLTSLILTQRTSFKVFIKRIKLVTAVVLLCLNISFSKFYT